MATSSEFARSIKAKYPQYQTMDDSLLTQKVLQKYPQYQSKITEPKKDGLIKSAVKGLIRPAVNAARDVGGGLYSGGAAVAEIAQRLTVDPQNKSKTFDKEFNRGMSIATPKGREALLGQDIIPSKQIGLGAQRGAGVASYLVPGGKTLGTAAKLGAVSGGLYGASEGDKIGLGNIAGGALGGAAGGAIGYGLIKGVNVGTNKVGGVTKALKNKIQNTAVDKATQGYNKATPSMFQKAVEEHGIDINELTRKHVAPGADYDTMLGVVGKRGKGGILGDKMKLNEGKIAKEISTAGSNVKVVADDFAASMRKEIRDLKKVPGNEANIKALEQLVESGEKLYKKGLTTKQLLDIKRQADSKFGKAVVDENTGSVAAQYQKMLGNWSRTKLKKALPAVAGALDEESEIFTLRPILERARGTANTQGSKIRNGSFNNLSDAINPFAYADAALRNPGTASKIMNKGMVKPTLSVGGGVSSQLPARVGLAGSKIGQSIGVGATNPEQISNYGNTGDNASNYNEANNIQSEINHGGIINPMSSTPQQEETLSPGGQWKWDAASNDWIPNAPQQEAGNPEDMRGRIYQLALKDLQETGGKNFAKLQQLAEFYDYANPAAEEGKAKTEGQVARQEISTLTSDAIGQLKATPNIKIGILAGPTENLKAKFDRADPATYTFNITLDQIRGAIAKARAGSAMSPQELALLDAYTPKVGDSRQEVVTKLMNLQKNFADNEALF